MNSALVASTADRSAARNTQHASGDARSEMWKHAPLVGTRQSCSYPRAQHRTPTCTPRTCRKWAATRGMLRVCMFVCCMLHVVTNVVRSGRLCLCVADAVQHVPQCKLHDGWRAIRRAPCCPKKPTDKQPGPCRVACCKTHLRAGGRSRQRCS
jgi:hypothetical protein